jgi:hypothetical protein
MVKTACTSSTMTSAVFSEEAPRSERDTLRSDKEREFRTGTVFDWEYDHI